MRRLEMPEVAGLLGDGDPSLVLEAARAVYDVPVPAGLPRLAALWTRTDLPDPLLHRVMGAHFRLGKVENARALAALAVRADVVTPLRAEAVSMLGDWAKPSGRDRVVGLWRPLEARPAADAVAALRPEMRTFLTGPEAVRSEWVKAAVRLGARAFAPALHEMFADARQPPALRAASLLALDGLKDARLAEVTTAALLDHDPRVRAAGRRVFARQDPSRAVALVAPALLRGQTVERQEALAVLGEVKRPEADRLLANWLDRLLQGDVPAEIRLDLLEAAGKRKAPEVKDRLARYEAARPKGDAMATYREALAGGDAEAGRRIFYEKAEVSCLRCHKAGGPGGDVGPDLKGIAGKQTREYLLESLVAPDAKIAKGYETVVLMLSDGRIETGILKTEDGKAVQLMTAEGKLVTVPKADIDGRGRGPSAMPGDVVRHLSRRELRDLVEFLARLK
jgi:quinoprotein glucose dehydrogenase